MDQIKRSWDVISKEKRTKFTEEFIQFFKEERGEEIGIIAAENLLDFFLQHLGMEIYNVGVEDAKMFFKKRFEDIEMDMDLHLKKQ